MYNMNYTRPIWGYQSTFPKLNETFEVHVSTSIFNNSEKYGLYFSQNICLYGAAFLHTTGNIAKGCLDMYM